MRALFIVATLLVSLSFTRAEEHVLNHNVLDGKWHKSGDLTITHEDVLDQNFKVEIKYKLKPKGLMGRLIKKFLSGQYNFNFPENMLYETGYESLKTSGPVELYHEDKVAILKYLDQVDVDGYQGAHKVEIRSKSTMSPKYPNGKWHIHLYYHPKVPSLGVFRSHIFYHGKAGNYEVISKLK
ncbi:MAG: hypothetical protein NXH75_06240 [Halobacteriovoraceae bacterium]|nr:hypothetical protein [Halobacteriovoraceae bacterium]